MRNNIFAQRRHRGFTLVEVMVALAIMSMVMVGLASLQLWSGRTIKEVYGETRMRSARMQSLDQLRFNLCNASLGSIALTQPNADNSGFHRIEFNDPNLGTSITSAFFYVTASNTLFYDNNVDDATPAIESVKGPIDISFNSDAANALIILKVKSLSHMRYADVDIQDGETMVYARNI